MVNKAYDKLDSIVAIVSSVADGKPAGCIVNSVSQVAGGKFSIAMNKENHTCEVIDKSGLFTIMLPTQDVAAQVIADFGMKSGHQLNKFASTPHIKDKKGVPYLTQDIAARFACRVTDKLDVGSHILFIGTVYEVENRMDAPVLTTSYYKSVKEGQLPKNAPAASTGEPGWRCTVCGYILESDEIPGGFKCPICGRGPNMLVKR